MATELKTLEEMRSLTPQGLPPLELLHALDIVPFYHELFSIDALVLQRNLQPYLEAASTAGIPVEFCSNHRAMVGQALTQAIPDPDLLLLQTDCCDNKLKTWEIFFDHYACPRFLLDIPFTYREEGIAYIRRQLDQLVSFLEARSGKKLDFDRLAQSLEHSRRCHALYREINRMRAKVPSPLNSREARAQGAVFLAHIGCQIGCTMIRYFKDALQEEVGIPTLILDADLIDPTAMSLDEMQGKMEGFFEILDERKGG